MSEREHVALDGGAVDACRQTGLDSPLHVCSLKQLSESERARYWAALTLLSAGGGVLALVQDGDLSLTGPGIYEALLTRSWCVRFQDKKEMARLAQVAVEIAQRLDPHLHGAQHVADLQARAWAELANAYRAANQLRSSDHAFGKAYQAFTQGTGNLYLKARLFDLEASLLGTWREFSLAEDRLGVVAELYKELGESHLTGRALITQALYTFYSGRPEAALLLNSEGKKLVNPLRDPNLFSIAVHNDLLFLVDLGRYQEAKRALFDSRKHFIYEDRVNAVRLRWIEGRIDYGLKRLVSAELTFREVKEGFERLNLPFPSAIARLDLAMVLLSQDRFSEAEEEVLAARDLFRAIEVCREFLGALIFLEESFRRRTVTPILIQGTIAQIWRKNLQVGPRHFR